MARYTGPKDRLSRREGFDLFGKGSKLSRLNLKPGVHGPKGSMRAPSQYGRQLREKQKMKRFYGVLEKQFSRYVNLALNSKGNTGDALFWLLERRLDNVIYRLGFAKTRPQARQLVSHRHVLVNGKRVNIPSYQLVVGDTVSLTATANNVPAVSKLLADKEPVVPTWLKRKGNIGKVDRIIKREDIKEMINESDIIEFYSR
ncbi:MAG TPA: 30S ribosomal protein S4 [Candidatus Saccharimonadales bacterium]|nr:30S ribosomal protein S4 [Candidatus Saccharimonadales bacterium]